MLFCDATSSRSDLSNAKSTCGAPRKALTAASELTKRCRRRGVQLANGHPISGHDEGFASVELAHDLAAVVTEFSLTDLPRHMRSPCSTRATYQEVPCVAGGWRRTRREAEPRLGASQPTALVSRRPAGAPRRPDFSLVVCFKSLDESEASQLATNSRSPLDRFDAHSAFVEHEVHLVAWCDTECRQHLVWEQYFAVRT